MCSPFIYSKSQMEESIKKATEKKDEEIVRLKAELGEAQLLYGIVSGSLNLLNEEYKQLDAEISRLKAELAEKEKQHRLDAIHGQCTMEEAYNRITQLETENAALKQRVKVLLLLRKELKELINSAFNIVEMWSSYSPSQMEWKKEWLEKALEVIKE